MQDERSDFQEKINSLVAEKQGLQKKIRQLEKEMFELRGRLNAKVKQWSVCQKCSNVFLPQQNQVESGSPHSTDMLRSELDALRLEVTEIRHSLQGQVVQVKKAVFQAIDVRRMNNGVFNAMTNEE
ncbi:Leucine zipper putative tumor suppressor [Trichinella spiralis]